MSLRKSPIRTQAFLEANRRNAQNSTGPRTRRGKAQSCLNHLQTGGRSRVYRDLWYGLANAPPCSLERTARALLTPEQAAHPLFGELVDLFRWAEGMVVMDARWHRDLCEAKRKAWGAADAGPQEPGKPEAAGALPTGWGREQKKKMLKIDVRSRKVAENKRKLDILSCHPTDIFGSSAPILTENANLGATKVTFAMRFNRGCTAVTMPRHESQDFTNARGLVSSGFLPAV